MSARLERRINRKFREAQNKVIREHIVQPALRVLGPAGATGAQGSIGATGPVVDGVSGATGATGATGSLGATGPDGIMGTSGDHGVLGSMGATGPKVNGNTGATGFTGATGAIGAIGIAGSGGATGARGATGAAGTSFVMANYNFEAYTTSVVFAANESPLTNLSSRWINTQLPNAYTQSWSGTINMANFTTPRNIFDTSLWTTVTAQPPLYVNENYVTWTSPGVINYNPPLQYNTAPFNRTHTKIRVQLLINCIQTNVNNTALVAYLVISNGALNSRNALIDTQGCTYLQFETAGSDTYGTTRTIPINLSFANLTNFTNTLINIQASLMVMDVF